MSKISGDNRRWKGQARPVSELAAALLDPLIARRAGMKLDLIAGWSEIAGHDHAAYSMPEKILWPRRISEDDPFEPATLVVACDGARAILFQHAVTEVLERVNVYFGFNAIGRIKIVQKPVTKPRTRRARVEPKLDAEAKRRLDGIIGAVDDDRLRRSLEALGREVIARNGGGRGKGPGTSGRT
jgi:hypothetical protein